jgi:2-keto-4-pentenoate hydratase/2-oxohepta-3-ene-1,7-dioic acid hydratase in catechol pathway
VKLLTFDAGDGARAGVLEDGRVIDAWALLGAPHRGSLKELLADGRVEDLRGRLGDAGAPSHPLPAVQLLAPIPGPEKIVCIGLNYRKHAAEVGVDVDALPEVPTIFAKYPNALVPDGATVTVPTGKTDYEAEVAFVVGRRAKDVAEADALEYVAGYTLLNDLSARDLQGATPQWMPGKVFDGSAPCGPYLVTPEEAGPGDVVSTGTPEGVGMGRKPRVWLADGDEVVIESPTLGRLVTRISV